MEQKNKVSFINKQELLDIMMDGECVEDRWRFFISNLSAFERAALVPSPPPLFFISFPICHKKIESHHLFFIGNINTPVGVGGGDRFHLFYLGSYQPLQTFKNIIVTQPRMIKEGSISYCSTSFPPLLDTFLDQLNSYPGLVTSHIWEHLNLYSCGKNPNTSENNSKTSPMCFLNKSLDGWCS